jgi:tRNA pseudouridine38-40 synthase
VEKINRHLPTDTVKAFACFKATKSFDARRAAISRTYEYLLPLKCLRDDKNGELEMFREALKTFEGSHPFHNYTKRGLYGAGKGNDKNRKGRGNRNKKNALTEDDDGLGETSSSEEQELELEEEEKELPKRIETSGKHTYWLLEKDVDDLVHVMHYRRIHEFTCSKEPEIIEGFESYPFVRVKVYGESFMLHQIRKMIATAVLVALDSEETPTMPLSFIKASLCRPCRVVTPMAPPLTLFLTGAEFMSFRKTNHEEKTRAAAKVEEENESEEEDDKETEKRGGNPLRSLAISEETKNDIDRFRRERLYPKLAESFSNQDWDFFIENVQNVEPTREEYLNIVKQYESYDEMRKIRAKEKEEEEEEASMIEKSLL